VLRLWFDDFKRLENNGAVESGWDLENIELLSGTSEICKIRFDLFDEDLMQHEPIYMDG
jgi:hypothetical protein